MTIPGGSGLGGRRNVPLNPCVYAGDGEIVADPPPEPAEVAVRLSQRGYEGGDETVAGLQEFEEEYSSASLDVVEVIDTCALEVIASSRRQGESVRFFVSAPGQHPSSSSVGFINQGNTTLLECRMEASHIFSVSGAPVDVVYNPASFGWNSRNISVEAPEVRLLRRSWEAFFSGCGSSTSLRLQFCAGDGAYIVRAALQGYPHAHRIFVVVVAPSCTIDPALCFRVRHYRAEWDITSVCSGPGSMYPDYSILPRNWESRGLVDLSLYSSTFQGFLRLEVLYFQLEESIGHIQDDNEALQFRNLSADPRLRTARQRLEELFRLLSNYGSPIRYICWINLVEEALDEHTRDSFETCSLMCHFARSFFLIASQITIGILARGSGNIRLAAIGIPVFRSVSMIARSGVYVISRDQGRSSYWRRLALRSRILNILCLLYESAISYGLLVSGEASGFLVNGLLVYVVVRNLTVFCENIVILCSPLRGRIQGWLTVVSEEDIGTERIQNQEANRAGYIERVLRGTWDILEGVSTLVVGVSLGFAAASITNADNGTTELTTTLPATTLATTTAPTTGGTECIVPSLLVGVTVIATVRAIISDICQIRRMLRRLRGRQGVAVIPLVQVDPTVEGSPEEIRLVAMESGNRGRRGRRVSESLEDPERRDSRVIEEIPLVAMESSNRGRRGRRVSESLEDPDRRDSRVIEEIPLVAMESGNRDRRGRRVSEMLEDTDV